MDPKALPFPNRITVELTNNCNLSCVMCPRHHLDMKQGYMSWKLFKKIVDESSRHLPITLVPFFRGEALLHPEFIRMMRYAKQKGMGPIQLATNAMLLDEKTASGLLDAQVDFVSFSLDAIGKEHFESIRINAEYDTVIWNVDCFLALRRKKKFSVPEVQVSAVKTEKTKPYIKEFVKKWTGAVDRVRIYEEHSYDGNFGSLPGGKKREAKRRACHKVFTDMVIYWNGDVALCNHDWHRDDFVGNVSECSVESVWNGDRYQRIRRWHLQGADAVNDSTCRGCDHWKVYYRKNHMIGELYAHTKSK